MYKRQDRYTAKGSSKAEGTCTDASKEALQNLIWDKCFYRWYYTQLNKPQQDIVQKRIDSCLGINWGYTFLVAFASMAIGLVVTAGIGKLTQTWLEGKKAKAAAGAEEPGASLVGAKEEESGGQS